MSEIKSGSLALALNEKVLNEAFDIVRTNRTGLLSVIGFGAVRQAFDGYKMGWLEMSVSATASPTTAAALAASTTLAVENGALFRVGMIVSAKNSDEQIQVTAISSNNLTVVRGFGGTTAANIADEASIEIISVGRGENSLADTDGIVQPETVENFFQTMDTAIDFSRRALSTMQYGDTNAMAFQTSERLRQLAIQMDKTLIGGRKVASTVGGDQITYTGGLKYYNDQAGAIKVDASAGALTLDSINALNETVATVGGTTNTIVVGIKQARKLSALVKAQYGSERLADWSADEGAVMQLPGDLPIIGTVNRIVVDTNLNDDELFILDSNMLEIVPMAANNSKDSGAWRTLDATQPAQDGESVRVIGDFAIQMRNSKTHFARLHNLSVA